MKVIFSPYILNIITGVVAVMLIYQLKDLVDRQAPLLAIADQDMAMKLALFHTIFNVLGVLLISLFITQLVRFLETLFRAQEKDRDGTSDRYRELRKEMELSPG